MREPTLQEIYNEIIDLHIQLEKTKDPQERAVINEQLFGREVQYERMIEVCQEYDDAIKDRDSKEE